MEVKWYRVRYSKSLLLDVSQALYLSTNPAYTLHVRSYAKVVEPVGTAPTPEHCKCPVLLLQLRPRGCREIRTHCLTVKSRRLVPHKLRTRNLVLLAGSAPAFHAYQARALLLYYRSKNPTGEGGVLNFVLLRIKLQRAHLSVGFNRRRHFVHLS